MNVLILGATGWIGSATLVNMLEKYSDLKLTLVSSKKNTITFKSKKFDVIDFHEFKNLKNKKYDMFFNYAFLTGNKILKLQKEEYLKLTDNLIYGVREFLTNNDIKKSLLTSSGAIYWVGTSKETIYSSQKLKQESVFIEDCTNLNINFSVARIFGLIANFYNVSYQYALNSFIKQAKSLNRVQINSEAPVYRSYLFLDYLINFFEESSNNETFDAVNININLEILAESIATYFNVKYIEPNYLNKNISDTYISKNDFFSKNFKLNFKDELYKIIKFTEKPNNILLKGKV